MQHTEWKTGIEQAMESEDVREMLDGLREAERDIAVKMAEITHLREMMTRVTQIFGGGGGHGGYKDRMAETVAAISDLETEIVRDIDRETVLMQHLRMRIEHVPEHRERSVLQMRYLAHKEWGEIAELMDMRMEALMKMHRRAVHALEETEAAA